MALLIHRQSYRLQSLIDEITHIELVISHTNTIVVRSVWLIILFNLKLAVFWFVLSWAITLVYFIPKVAVASKLEAFHLLWNKESTMCATSVNVKEMSAFFFFFATKCTLNLSLSHPIWLRIEGVIMIWNCSSSLSIILSGLCSLTVSSYLTCNLVVLKQVGFQIHIIIRIEWHIRKHFCALTLHLPSLEHNLIVSFVLVFTQGHTAF